jgi:hypothetical protein
VRKAVGLGKEGGVDVDEAKTPERGEEVAREGCSAATMHVELCAAARSDMAAAPGETRESYSPQARRRPT